MKWLIWKDFRHNRPIVLFWLFLLLLPHLVVCGFIVNETIRRLPLPDPIWVPFARASLFSLMISQVSLVLIGGNAFAGERVDRSGEFLFSLPITHGKILLSKLFFSGIIVAITWLVNVPFLVPLLNVPNWPGNPHVVEMLIIAITGMVFFCIAWFLSSFLSSPTFAVGGGLIAPLLVIGTLSVIAYFFDIEPNGKMTEIWYLRVCLTLTPLCFAFGTWHYLRRVEP